ncbi:MAG: hypothetical protein WC326_12090 [Candidatus Delongbacteria bacterium]
MKTRRWGLGPGLAVLALLILLGCGGKVDERAAKELAALGRDVSLTVLPPAIRKGEELGYSPREGARVMAGLVDQGLLSTRLGDGEVSLSPGWKASQRALWKRTVRQCRAWLKNHPQSTPHVLFTEYLMGTRMVAAVHVLILDSNGRLAYGRALHSNDPLYAEMAPIGEGDCTNLVLSALRAGLNLSGNAR